MDHRTCVALVSLLAVVLAPMSARAQSDVTTDDAIRRALERPEAARRLEARLETSRARLERLRAQRDDLRSELTLRTREADRQTRAERTRLDAALDALEVTPDPSRDADLSRLAEVAFDANEASLTELLDAFESEANLRLARIDLQWEARRAAIALEHSLGLGVPR